MKIPRKVLIAGREWPVIYDPKADGAEWKSNPGEIRIGKHPNQEEKAIWFLHEVIEAILTMGQHRFECYPNEDNELFVFNHKELSKICREIYRAIKGIG